MYGVVAACRGPCMLGKADLGKWQTRENEIRGNIVFFHILRLLDNRISSYLWYHTYRYSHLCTAVYVVARVPNAMFRTPHIRQIIYEYR